MGENKYTQLDSCAATADVHVSRRQFLKAAGGGIMVFFWLGHDSELEAQRRRPPEDFNAYIRIGPDGRVTCFTGKIEMGQGVITSLAQMLAEELDVAVASVDMVMGDTKLCPYDAGTWGSQSTPRFGEGILRAAGAEARALLGQVRCLVRVGQDEEAIKILLNDLANGKHEGTIDANERLISPNAELLALELMEGPSHPPPFQHAQSACPEYRRLCRYRDAILAKALSHAPAPERLDRGNRLPHACSRGACSGVP